MYIRVPTGMYTLSQKAQAKRLILFQCTKCGKVHAQELQLETLQSAQYHIFGGKAARQKAENKVSQRIEADLQKQDNELFQAINVNRDYGKIHTPVVCPDCGEKQIWSTIPKPWKKTRGFGLWAFAVFLMTMMLLMTLTTEDMPWFIPLPYLCILLILPLVHNRKRKKSLELLKNAQFYPPRYYNQQNIHELR